MLRQVAKPFSKDLQTLLSSCSPRFLQAEKANMTELQHRLRELQETIDGVLTAAYWEGIEHAILQWMGKGKVTQAASKAADDKIAKATNATAAAEAFHPDEKQALQAKLQEKREKWQVLKKIFSLACGETVSPTKGMFPDIFGVCQELKCAIEHRSPLPHAGTNPALVAVAATGTSQSQAAASCRDEPDTSESQTFLAVAAPPQDKEADHEKHASLANFWFGKEQPNETIKAFVAKALEELKNGCQRWLGGQHAAVADSVVVDILAKKFELDKLDPTDFVLPGPGPGPVTSEEISSLKACSRCLGPQAALFSENPEVTVETRIYGMFVQPMVAIALLARTDDVDMHTALGNTTIHAGLLSQLSATTSADGEPSAKAAIVVDVMKRLFRETFCRLATHAASDTAAIIEDAEAKMAVPALDLADMLAAAEKDTKAIAALQALHKHSPGKNFSKARAASASAMEILKKIRESLLANAAAKDIVTEGDRLVVQQAGAALTDRLGQLQVKAAELAIVQASFGAVPRGMASRKDLKPVVEAKITELGVTKEQITKKVFDLVSSKLS